MESPKTFIIIGDGVASWRVNLELERKFVDAKIIKIGSDDFAPSCTFRSTAINCLRGTRKGISKLGDLLVDSHHCFENALNEEKIGGVEVAREHQVWDPDDRLVHEKWERRYGGGDRLKSVEEVKFSSPLEVRSSKAYLISPPAFASWHRSQLKNTQHINDFVVEVYKRGNGYKVLTLKGKEFICDKLFLCSNQFSHLFISLIEDQQVKDYLKRSKPVRGGYLSCNIQNFRQNFRQSFSVAFNNKHLIFRKSENTLLIGSDSENDCSTLTDRRENLFKTYSYVKSFLAEPELLPPFEDMAVNVGVRHKGPKRLPFWGEMGTNLYGMFGLYKNGFSFSFLGAKDLVEDL